MERGLVTDAAIADSLEHRRAFWHLRDMLPEAQKPEGGSIKHDVSVPVAAVPEFLSEADAAVQALIPGARPVPFGHLGDGNIHYNVSQPVGADNEAFLARWDEMNAAVHAIVAQVRRLDLGRARHRRDEARAAAAGEGPGRARLDAHAQAHARSQRNPQSGQGALKGHHAERQSALPVFRQTPRRGGKTLLEGSIGRKWVYTPGCRKAKESIPAKGGESDA